MSERAGKYVVRPEGHRAFVPNQLPPKPPIKYDGELQSLLSKADRELARLDGITTVLPNSDLFIAMYVKKEALLSSQIEGTQASLEGILEFEANLQPKDDINEIKEVVNYVKALNYGLENVKDKPFSLDLIREIHKILLEGVRGARKAPGEFRKVQNWLGPPGATIDDATFVPPPPDMVLPAMKDLEKFIRGEDDMPPLVKIALVHSQFETIHPFLDGNGRIGRLLVTFYLSKAEILSKPILYLSFYLKKNWIQYYDLLMKVRTDGAWEEWVKFFLRGISETSREAAETARRIIGLKGEIVAKLYENGISGVYAVRLVDLLFENPLISATDIVGKMRVSKETASDLVRKFEGAGILKEITGKQRYKKYMFREYVDIIAKGTRENIVER